MENFSRSSLSTANTIVIKVGSSSLLDKEGCLSQKEFDKIASEISNLKKLNKNAILVSSGAIAAGKEYLPKLSIEATIQEKQAAAAIGQGRLMQFYERSFAKFGLLPAQVLLTRDVISNRTRYINARNTINQIINFNAIPIINENDVISDEEIKFGDNDTLSAIVANLLGADLLIILSDVEGFMANGKVVNEIEKINPDIERYAKGAGSSKGTGGMITKLSAAKISISAGIPVVIAGFFKEDVIKRILQGEKIGTLFIPKESKILGKKRWLLGNKKIAGKIVVDDGAKKALAEKGKSLLPIGVKDIKGHFERGDIVGLFDQFGKEFARGIINYNSKELAIIKGKSTKEAKTLIKALPSDEIVHRNNMVIL